MKKIAWITGASGGIGLAVAEEFAKEGYELALCGRKQAKALENLGTHLRDTYGIKVLTFIGDISDSDYINRTKKKIERELGAVSVLVNNAGISKIGLLQDMSDEEWKEIMDVNLTSMFYTSRAVIPSMVSNQSGCIINISSVWGSVGASCEVAYSATKGGVNAFTKALAKELAPSHVSVNALACGVIDTPMNGHLDEAEKEQLAEEIPYGRYANPSEVAAAIVNLAKMPTYLTGQVIHFDGGWQ